MSDVENAHQQTVEELQNRIAAHQEEERRLVGMLEQARKEADLFYRALQEVTVRLCSVQAVRHLQRHDRMALTGNADAGIDVAITSALSIINKAENDSDRIPF